jgi:hypothetical protein
MVTQQPVGCGASTIEALHDALDAHGFMSSEFIEVLDVGESGWNIWTGGVVPRAPVSLSIARRRHRTVFRGGGYAEYFSTLPAIPLKR